MENEFELSKDRPTIGDLIVTNRPLTILSRSKETVILPMGAMGTLVELHEFPNVAVMFMDEPTGKEVTLDLPVNILLPHFH